MFGNEGNDSAWVSGGSSNDTVFGGIGNDSIFQDTRGRPQFFGNEGNDTINAFGATTATIVGGNDSADGTDSLTGGTGARHHLRQRRGRLDRAAAAAPTR